MKKWRVDFFDTDPTTLETKRIPCWEFDGKQVVELHWEAEWYRKIAWGEELEWLTPKDGMKFMRALRHNVRGTFIGASDPYEVDG